MENPIEQPFYVATDEAKNKGFHTPPDMIGKVGVCFTTKEFNNFLKEYGEELLKVACRNADTTFTVNPGQWDMPEYDKTELHNSITEMLDEIVEQYKIK